MSDQTGRLSCTLWCFALGLLAGALATILLVIFGGFGWNGAVFTGVVLALVLGLFLKVVFCKPLPTMAEIRARNAGQAAAAPVRAAHAPEPVRAPAPAPAAAAAVKPVFLTAARGARPDDLKLIKGVGPKLEQMLHGMGVFHFDQIAAWTPAEVAWVDDNLEGFKGRVSRDEWVAQARILAAGGSV
jgi:predicted flap endonuclease-1-like 5' DNA nuclease